MGLSNKGDSIVVFTLVTFFFIFFFIFLVYFPRWVYLTIKNNKTAPGCTDISNWFHQGLDATGSMVRRRRNRAQEEAGRSRTKDIEMGDVLQSSSQGRVVVTLPGRAKISDRRFPGMI
ncbi:hypothetical protein MFRU_017g01600 [Monilinia fructicola]|nr:hypothetical protein MFRU_017g01600 [Monilinia fructicola]